MSRRKIGREALFFLTLIFMGVNLQENFSGAERPKREEGANPSRTRRCNRVWVAAEATVQKMGWEGAATAFEELSKGPVSQKTCLRNQDFTGLRGIREVNRCAILNPVFPFENRGFFVPQMWFVLRGRI